MVRYWVKEGAQRERAESANGDRLKTGAKPGGFVVRQWVTE
jgi:hypothetical protein